MNDSKDEDVYEDNLGRIQSFFSAARYPNYFKTKYHIHINVLPPKFAN